MNLEKELSHGKPNSLGNTLKVVEYVSVNPSKFTDLTNLFFSQNPLVAMRAMNAVKRLLKLHPFLFDQHRSSFIGKFATSESSIIQLGLITIYFDSYSRFTNVQKTKIKNVSLAWTQTATDWMVLVQGLKLLERLAIDDPVLRKDVIKLAKRLQKDPRKAVATKAQRILENLS